MTTAEVCELLRIHQTTVYRLIRKRQIPCFQVGSDYRFNRATIDQWRRAQERATQRNLEPRRRDD
jgi:excisionase family DNA binding protein